MNAQTSTQTLNLFTSIIGTSLTVEGYIMCALAAVGCGALLAIVLAIFTSPKKYSFSFLSTVVLLPLIVQSVITLVNGNIGTGVAVAGAFSLVRFRSAPGSAKDIAMIFLSMAIGLGCGIGYVGVSAVLTGVGAVIIFLLWLVGRFTVTEQRDLRITVPESLDYEGMFDEIFSKYTKKHTLTSVKTTNLGSLFKLRYQITMKSGASEKALIDELRVRNGNLEIAISEICNDMEVL